MHPKTIKDFLNAYYIILYYIILYYIKLYYIDKLLIFPHSITHHIMFNWLCDRSWLLLRTN